ncbi:MAG: hypothetical protein LIR50_15535 [Bacillota bacterium]|nr:hypothetical protein [Bacillota bacterium]
MNTRFQSALNQIKADEVLINKTEIYLREKLKEDQKSKIIKFPKHRLIYIKNLAKAACILFILIGGGTGTYAYYKTPVAYLSLDINPSIELGVNAFDKVVSAEGYNADGRTVLNGIDVTGVNIETAVSTVISSADDNGFIESDGSTVVSLTSETDNINISNKLKTDAETGVNKALKEKGKVAVIYKDNVALAFRYEARALSITPGKLNLINKLQAVNPVAAVDQYKDAKVKDIVKDTKTYADNNAVNKEEAANSKGTNVVSIEKENAAVIKTKSTVNIKKENIESSKKESTVSSEKENTVISEKEGTVTNKDTDDAKNKEKETVNSQQESSANNKRGGTVSNNKKDTGEDKDKIVRKHHK